MKKLFLLDGHALVYRAHYAFINRPLINSKGMNTSAVNGFVRMLWDLIRKEHPTHLAVSFDLPTPTFRHGLFEFYKANREAQPEDITFALPYIQEIIRAFRIPVVTCEGYEADDVIGTLSKQAEAEGYTVYMVTPDKDYAQLVSDNIFLYKPSRSGNEMEILGVPEVLADWNIKSVDQVIDILGLEGDKVDNIPGIPGIGEKTAIALIEKYGSVEEVLAHAHELKGKQRENVEKFAEQALLSKKLATIDINVPIRFDADTYIMEPFERERLAAIFRELEFRTLAQAILGAPEPPRPVNEQMNLFSAMSDQSERPSAAPPVPEHSIADKNINNTPHTYHIARTRDEMQALVKTLLRQKAVCFDTETTDLDPNLAELVGMSFSFKSHEAWYVPVPADKKEAHAVAELFRPFFENEHIEKIGQNIKYDAIVLKWYGIALKGRYFDTMLAHYLMEPELRHNMNYMSETYLKYAPVTIETLIGGKGKGQGNMRDVPLEKIADYAAEDADVTFQLRELFAPQLRQEKLEWLFDEMECPLVRVLTDIEYEGVRVDSAFLAAYSRELDRDIAAIEAEIFRHAGMKFNIASPKQVGEVLFDFLKVPYRWRKTKTGQYSTDEEILSELALELPLVERILAHRSLSKLKSTYVDALPRMINPRTGRIHSSFNQALTATGRLSSNNPNLQNIPIRTPEGGKVRQAFVARDKDHVLLSADYSQIELRLIAEISGDEAMIEAFRSGTDIHLATASKVYNVALDLVTPQQRRNAKTVNFSIIYGAGAQNLSNQLGISRTEARGLIEQYFSQYKGLKKYMEKTVDFARHNGYVATLLGRRRYLRDIDSRNSLARSNAERMAINTPIQGTAADMIKMAMIKIHRDMEKAGLQSKMILQVHDELVFDVRKAELDAIRPIIEEGMKHAIPDLKVPIEVGMGTGDNWLEAH